MGVFLYICCLFSEYLFLEHLWAAASEFCWWILEKIISKKKLKKNKKKIQKKKQLKLQWGYAFGTLVFQNH